MRSMTWIDGLAVFAATGVMSKGGWVMSKEWVNGILHYEMLMATADNKPGLPTSTAVFAKLLIP